MAGAFGTSLIANGILDRQMVAILNAGVLLVLVGLLDDAYNLPAKLKLTAQLGATALLISDIVARVVLAPQEAIIAAINLAYDMSRASAKDFFEEMNEESADDLISEINETADLLDETSDAPIIKLVNLLLSHAIKDRASDIHIEPMEKGLRVRYRIDGVLRQEMMLPKKVQLPLVSRVKIISKLDITERRMPQDGRIKMKISGRPVSTMAATFRKPGVRQ